eukprot:12284567-Karenia_brevis.AAC.1
MNKKLKTTLGKMWTASQAADVEAPMTPWTSKPLKGQKDYRWKVLVEQGWVSLPEYVGRNIYLEACKRLQVLNGWNMIKAQRLQKGKHNLTNKQMTNYNAFMTQDIRKMVFNKSSKTVIMNPSKLTRSYALDCSFPLPSPTACGC